MSEILHPTIYKDSTGELFLEMSVDDLPIIHCYIYKWSKDTYKKQREVWKEVMAALAELGYNTVYAAALDDKLVRFAKMFGFVLTPRTVLDSRGDERRVLECSIN